jgi:thioredoxin-like negative regulator of GroEL
MKINQEELTSNIKQNAAMMLYFYNDHCAPCLSLRPKVDELAKQKFPEMKLAFINSEGNESITAQYGVFSNPTIIVFFEGKEYKRFSKYISTSELEEAIDRPYQLLFS